MIEHNQGTLESYFLVNSLTVSRAGLSLGAALSMYFGSQEQAYTFLLLAIGTDLVDGKLARFLRVSSNKGTGLDALADGALFTASWALLSSSHLKEYIAVGDTQFVVLGVLAIAFASLIHAATAPVTTKDTYFKF